MPEQKFFMFLGGKQTDEDGLDYRNSGRILGPFATDSEREEVIGTIVKRRSWNGERIVFLRFEGLMTDGPIKPPSLPDLDSTQKELSMG